MTIQEFNNLDARDMRAMFFGGLAILGLMLLGIYA